MWLPVVSNQIVLCTSIVTACLPYLRPFMESLESGIVRVENLYGSEEEFSRDRTGSTGYFLTDQSNSTPVSRDTNRSARG
ncbi:hypothetical protein F5X99DRAFT_384658, partial [Biscogniauxia marginata]